MATTPGCQARNARRLYPSGSSTPHVAPLRYLRELPQHVGHADPIGQAVTYVGRNVDTFAMLIRWASRNRHEIDEHDIHGEAEHINELWPSPMRPSEVECIAESVSRYRSCWRAFSPVVFCADA